MKTVTVARWASFQEAEELPGPWVRDGAGQSTLPAAYREALRSTGRRITGAEHQSLDDGSPIFSDGTAIADGWRGWGALMAEIWSEVDGLQYDYMDFYHSGWGAAAGCARGHDIRIVELPHGSARWTCPCGAGRSTWYGSHEEAMTAARYHTGWAT